jgi:hypothetical protein
MPIGVLHSHVSARLQLMLVFQVSFWKSGVKDDDVFFTPVFFFFSTNRWIYSETISSLTVAIVSFRDMSAA